jgi:hemolysin D
VSLKSSAKTSALASVRQFQSEVAAIRESDEPRSAKLTVHVLALMVLGAALVMMFARVDRVISSTAGRMVTTEPASVFQALDPSVIKSIDVKEGQRVEKGEILATLDPTFAEAAVNQLKAQIDSLKTQIARDQAEIDHRPLVFAPNSDPDYGKYEKLQTELYNQHMAQYNAQISSFDQKMASTEATIQKYKVDAARYQDEEDIAKQIETMRATLQQHGTGSLLNLLTSTDAKLEALRTKEFDHNSVKESEFQLASLKADREAFIQQFKSTASQDLVTSRNTLDGAEAQLESAMKHQQLVRLEAPEASIVLSIAKLSVGSVLKQGDTLLTLTPIRVPVEAEIQVSARDVGFLRAGDPATIKFDAFNYAEHGTGEGKVRWISEDAFTTDENGAPVPAYYKARIAITATNLINVPASFRLIPGMRLTADIKVGRRSIADYVLGEMVHGAGSSMREP